MSEHTTITGLPVPVRERYVTRQQLADLMGLSLRTVDKMTSEGMPSVTWGLRTRRYLASEATEWALARRNPA